MAIVWENNNRTREETTSKLESFKQFLNKNKLSAQLVDAHWPYNYNDNKAYIVTYKGSKRYFYFNDEGQLLVQKEVE